MVAGCDVPGVERQRQTETETDRDSAGVIDSNSQRKKEKNPQSRGNRTRCWPTLQLDGLLLLVVSWRREEITGRGGAGIAVHQRHDARTLP